MAERFEMSRIMSFSMWTNVVESGSLFTYLRLSKESIRPWNFGNERYPEIDITFSLSRPVNEKKNQAMPSE